MRKMTAAWLAAPLVAATISIGCSVDYSGLSNPLDGVPGPVTCDNGQILTAQCIVTDLKCVGDAKTAGCKKPDDRPPPLPNPGGFGGAGEKAVGDAVSLFSGHEGVLPLSNPGGGKKIGSSDAQGLVRKEKEGKEGEKEKPTLGTANLGNTPSPGAPQLTFGTPNAGGGGPGTTIGGGGDTPAGGDIGKHDGAGAGGAPGATDVPYASSSVTAGQTRFTGTGAEGAPGGGGAGIGGGFKGFGDSGGAGLNPDGSAREVSVTPDSAVSEEEYLARNGPLSLFEIVHKGYARRWDRYGPR